MEDLKISVVMNCYNGDKYLREAIESVFAQTYSNWELIFWDNHSTDRSAEIFQSYNDHRCKYFYAPRHTELGEARNQAVEVTTGDWITFLDCDDILFPDKISQQVKIIKKDVSKSIGLVYCRTRIKGGLRDGQDYSNYFRERHLPIGSVLATLLLVENFIAIPSALFRKDLFLRLGGMPDSFKRAEDFYLFAGLAALAPVGALQEFGCEYRIHGVNLSYRHRESVAREIVATIEAFEVHLDAVDRKRAKRVKREWLAKAGLYGMFEQRKLTFPLLFSFFTAGPFYALRVTATTAKNYLRLIVAARGSN